jgi:hypothetical protein
MISRRVSLNVNCRCCCNETAISMLDVCQLPLAVFVECKSFYALRAYLYSVTANTIAVRVKINCLLVLTMGSYNVLV